MKTLLLLCLVMLLLSCSDSHKATTDKESRLELVPEPDKAERLEYEALQQLKNSRCVFHEPDTSVSGITLADAESALKVIGKMDKMDANEQYVYYSNHYNETLTLTQHPGDSRYEMSVFKVAYADKADQGYRKLDIEAFTSEKGIQLGLSKRELVQKLGNCYAAIDSSQNHIELRYQIESPADSDSGLLAKHNMPVYYASYTFLNDRLKAFEFGFEYP